MATLLRGFPHYHSAYIIAAVVRQNKGAKASSARLRTAESTRYLTGRQEICCSKNRPESETKMTEIEVKIRLPGKESYSKLASLLAEKPIAEYHQENYFFDGSNKELSSRFIVARVRLYNKTEKATLTIKGKAIVENGIARASEVEEELAVDIAQQALKDPNVLLSATSMFQNLQGQYGLQSLTALGGFLNTRRIYKWEGETLELDETQFEHGTMYELECETESPEAVRNKLEAFLTANDIPFSYSKVSKFANFVNKSML